MTASLDTSTDRAIGPDRSPGVSAPMREIECTSGDGQSEACTEGLGPDAWAIAHARATGHSGFREITTEYLRVVPAGSRSADPTAPDAVGDTVARPSGPVYAPPSPERQGLGLDLCWVPKPDAPARNCTLGSGHEGDHHHEYADVVWPRDEVPPRRGEEPDG
ncbi:hypothetical protein ACFYT4_25190 [Streptomyces sp. NPDC004609]|uniref:DUF7848 domain-containing protein n=1 Tax=Streptomyces sp. NPDC004609 TaxID=3364704 RepID=UPI003681B663